MNRWISVVAKSFVLGGSIAVTAKGVTTITEPSYEEVKK